MDQRSVSITPTFALREMASGAPSEASSSHELDDTLLRLHSSDPCLLVCVPIAAHSSFRISSTHVVPGRPLARGVTIAARDLACGEEVRRCGEVVGWVTRRVAAGTPLNMGELAGPPASALH